MNAVAIAGGKATRFGEISKYIPKCMLPVKGKPILFHTLEQMQKEDLTNVLCLGAHSDYIKYCVQKRWMGREEAYVEEEPAGTAGALKIYWDSQHKQSGYKDTRLPYVAYNADSLYDLNLKEFTDKGRAFEGVTIAVADVADARGYGLVDIDNRIGDFAQIRGFLEKPTEETSGFVSTGMYCINMDLSPYIKDGFSMLETDVFPQLAKEGKLFAYLKADWAPIDDVEKLEKAEEWYNARNS